jgi:hypothetical protein
MRIKPLHLAAAVAIALSGSTVLAQSTGGTLRIVPSNTTSTNNSTAASTSSTGTATAVGQTGGGCAGTGGSSCTATNSNASGTTSGTTTSSSSTPGVVTTQADTFGSTLQSTPSGASSATGSGMGTNQSSVDPAATRPDSFAPGGTFGANTGTTTTVPGSTVNGQAFLPGTTGAVVLDGSTMQPPTGNQQNVVIQQPAQPQARAATPIFDAVARDGLAKERARRARGQEPRIIGIAPRTDVDRTHQMPDDPIIRY